MELEELIRLTTLAQQRSRLTQNLAIALDRIAATIAANVPPGTSVSVPGGGTYEVVYHHSNLGGRRFLERDGRAFESDNGKYVGDSFYLHNDYRARVDVATREMYLDFARDLEDVLAGFCTTQEELVAALDHALAKILELGGADTGV